MNFSEFITRFFIHPLGFLGLLAIPVIIIIYIIRSKYKPKTVSSTFIWKRSLKYVKRKIPINFIMSLLLIMQILVALAATFAITRPLVIPPNSGETIVIVDASASMNTTDGEKTRFEIAKDKLREAAENVGENARMSIILADSRESFTYEGDSTEPISSPVEILKIIDGLECTKGTSNIFGALKLAEKRLEDNKGAKVVVYTDKQHAVQIQSRNNLEVVLCSRAEETNAGIVSVTDNLLAAGYRFDAVLKNYGKSNSFQVILTANLGYGEEKHIGTTTVTMNDEEELEVVFTPVKNAQVEQGKNQVIVPISTNQSFDFYEYIRVDINVQDGLDDDNSFVLYSEVQQNPSILLVSNSLTVADNGVVDPSQMTLLRNALGSLGYVIRSTDMYKRAEDVPDEKLSGYDLYIFEGVMPKIVPTDGAVWFLNAPSSPTGTGVVLGEEKQSLTSNGFGIVEYDPLAKDEESLIIKNNVDFSEGLTLNIGGQEVKIPAALSKYKEILNTEETPLPDNFRVIYSLGNGSPIMLAGKVGTVRTMITNFDFSNSSLTIFVSDFPILIKNMVEYSIAAPLPNRNATIGQDLIFSAPAGASEVNCYFTSYEKGSEPVAVPGGTWNSDYKDDLKVSLDELGSYQMEVFFYDNTGALKSTQYYTLTTQIPEEETSIFSIGETLEVELIDNAKEEVHEIEILPWVLLVLIVLLIIEWGVYYRDEH